MWAIQGALSTTQTGSISGLNLAAVVYVSLASYTSNVTYGDISSQVSFLGASANISASFITSKSNATASGLQNLFVSFLYNDPQNLFAMAAQLDYNSKCVVGVSGVIGSGSFSLNAGSVAPDASFDLAVAYYKCAAIGQTQWLLNASRISPLVWNGASLSDVMLQVTGSPAPANTTFWSGNLQGSLKFSGIAANASISFDSASGIKELYANIAIKSTYLDLTASLQYAKINCSLINSRVVSGPLDPAFLGSKGQATIRLHSICLFSLYL